MKCVCELESHLARLKEDEMSAHNFVLIFSTACFLFKNTMGIRKTMRQDVSELKDVKRRLDAIYHSPAFQRLKADSSKLGPILDLRFIIGFFEGKD